MPEIQSINHRHEGIINWLVTNPHRSLGECAQELGYTQPWLTQIIHSDMFQTKYQERCQEVGELAVHTVKNRLTAVAMMALDKTEERMQSGGASERFLTDTTKNVLSALGYTPQTMVAGPSMHQHLHVDAQTLIDARQRASQRFQPATREGEQLQLQSQSNLNSAQALLAEVLE